MGTCHNSILRSILQMYTIVAQPTKKKNTKTHTKTKLKAVLNNHSNQFRRKDSR